jgi:hypothetical protein
VQPLPMTQANGLLLLDDAFKNQMFFARRIADVGTALRTGVNLIDYWPDYDYGHAGYHPGFWAFHFRYPDR